MEEKIEKVENVETKEETKKYFKKNVIEFSNKEKEKFKQIKIEIIKEKIKLKYIIKN